jgi:DNA-directed RNA polymerase subunit RPC12/RpoP
MAEYKCSECDKDFNSPEALKMHNDSKHYKAPRRSVSKKQIRNWGIFVVIVLVIVGSVYAWNLNAQRPGKYDDFAQCLTDSGAKEYGAYWCGNCQTQKAMFGKSFENVSYIECSLPNNGGQNQICKDAGIEAYPTWEFGDGERITGVISLERLAVITGCEL